MTIVTVRSALVTAADPTRVRIYAEQVGHRQLILSLALATAPLIGFAAACSDERPPYADFTELPRDATLRDRARADGADDGGVADEDGGVADEDAYVDLLDSSAPIEADLTDPLDHLQHPDANIFPEPDAGDASLLEQMETAFCYRIGACCVANYGAYSYLAACVDIARARNEPFDLPPVALDRRSNVRRQRRTRSDGDSGLPLCASGLGVHWKLQRSRCARASNQVRRSLRRQASDRRYRLQRIGRLYATRLLRSFGE